MMIAIMVVLVVTVMVVTRTDGCGHNGGQSHGSHGDCCPGGSGGGHLGVCGPGWKSNSWQSSLVVHNRLLLLTELSYLIQPLTSNIM